jgi:O-succinylbenzoic acid--CoA ligase
MLITDEFTWSHATFEDYVEGMCRQVETFPHQRVAFWAPSTPEVILTFFACWKTGKIACPLNTRLPSAEHALKQLETELFTPSLPEPEAARAAEWDLTRLGTLLFTSGSTGQPKIAALSLGNLVSSAIGSYNIIPLQPEDRWALTLPLFHVGGLGILFRSYLAKSFVLLSSNWKQATHLSLVPVQLYRLLKTPTEMLHLKTILLGGAPLPGLKTPWNVLPSYGMTEMSSQIITHHHIHPYAEVKIAEDQEIWVRGLVLFQGYYEKGKIVLPLHHGWFQTKDLGRWDNGLFKVIGRKDNLFISGGENIQPEEIEDVIRRVCGLPEVVIVPIPDQEFGARPAVFLKDPVPLEELQEMLKFHLPKYKIPIKSFELPETGLKPNRKALAEMICQQGQ